MCIQAVCASVRACQNLSVKFRCVCVCVCVCVCGGISKQKENQHRIRHLEQEIIKRADGGKCDVF